MRAHFDFGLTVQKRGSAYLHEIYDCERRNVRYDIFDQGLSCGRTKKLAEIDLQRVHNRKSHALRTAFAVKPLWICGPSGFGIRDPGSGVRGPGRWGSRHTPRGSKPHQPRIKKGAPRKGSFWTKWNRQGDDGSCKTSRKEGYRSTGAEYTVLFILCQE